MTLNDETFWTHYDAKKGWRFQRKEGKKVSIRTLPEGTCKRIRKRFHLGTSEDYIKFIKDN